MSSRKTWTRKTRRKWKAKLTHGPQSRPIHTSPKGRTGTAHSKARGGQSRKRWLKLATLVMGPDWTAKYR